VIFGLASAIFWGSAEIIGTVASRRIGSFATVAVGQTAGTLIIAPIVLLSGASLSGSGEAAPWLVSSGVIVAVAYLSFYRALQLGPIALVSPIGAGYGAISVMLAVVVLGEEVHGWTAVGVASALLGIVLTARDPVSVVVGGVGRKGVPYAVLSVIGFGVGAFLLGAYSQDLGWTVAVFLSRLGVMMALLSVVAYRMLTTGSRRTRPLRAVNVLLAAGAGVLDLAGQLAFARASQLGLVSLAAAVSATYPMMPILVGVSRFGERLVTSQWLGIALVIGGLVALGVAA
jgi:uncharacterized membrane protein